MIILSPIWLKIGKEVTLCEGDERQKSSKENFPTMQPDWSKMFLKMAQTGEKWILGDVRNL